MQMNPHIFLTNQILDFLNTQSLTNAVSECWKVWSLFVITLEQPQWLTVCERGFNLGACSGCVKIPESEFKLCKCLHSRWPGQSLFSSQFSCICLHRWKIVELLILCSKPNSIILTRKLCAAMYAARSELRSQHVGPGPKQLKVTFWA